MIILLMSTITMYLVLDFTSVKFPKSLLYFSYDLLLSRFNLPKEKMAEIDVKCTNSIIN